jgi:lipopolysaccharide transport system ATP-binding protein
MTQPAIKVEGLWKEYVVGHAHEQHDTFYELLAQTLKAPLKRLRSLGGQAQETERFWALRDVNFEVQPGEVVGIIGRNGAGKSTLLKILSRITAPTKGRIEVRGRLASLLEVGTGFHPELSGRENIYLNGAILGMMRKEVAHKFDEIVAFAEIEKFIDTPVKRYSSGMYVRLAFSVAAHLETDVLVIDEVLAVGDRQFQERCLRQIQSLTGEAGRTVLFVSHNIDAVQRICSRAIYLTEGRLVAQGPVAEVARLYVGGKSHLGEKSNLLHTRERSGSGVVKVKSVEVFDNKNGMSASILESGGSFTFAITCQVFGEQKIANSSVTLELADQRGVTVLLVSSLTEGSTFDFLPPMITIRCAIDELNLAAGEYALTVYLGAAGGDTLDLLKDVLRVTVAGGDFFGTGHPGFPDFCRTLVRSAWKVDHAVE